MYSPQLRSGLCLLTVQVKETGDPSGIVEVIILPCNVGARQVHCQNHAECFREFISRNINVDPPGIVPIRSMPVTVKAPETGSTSRVAASSRMTDTLPLSCSYEHLNIYALYTSPNHETQTDLAPNLRYKCIHHMLYRNIYKPFSKMRFKTLFYHNTLLWGVKFQCKRSTAAS